MSNKKEIHPQKCILCNKDIPIREWDTPLPYSRKKFCSNSCAAKYNNHVRALNKRSDGSGYKVCLNCGKEIKSLKYCSQKCKNDYHQKMFEEKWLNGEVSGNTDSLWIEPVKGVKKYLFKKYNNKCARCGWGEVNPFTGRIPLEVEHIDGNANNTTPDNVTLLCPNCHSLTSTYRGANRGKGRGKTWRPK